jgi:hypothetical protein
VPSAAPSAPRSRARSATPSQPPLETLAASIQRRLAFPFQPDCQGNTQEIVACLWQRRDRQDQRLATLLGSAEALETWRGARAAACRRSAERGSGGSIQQEILDPLPKILPLIKSLVLWTAIREVKRIVIRYFRDSFGPSPSRIKTSD